MAVNGTKTNGTSRSAETPDNPSGLDSRFEIRRLEAKHIPWANTIVIHSNMFHSPVWPVLYPEAKTARALKLFDAMDYLVRHQVESGMSFGVFDTQYEYKRPESAATEGALYWDQLTEDASPEDLLAAMDFPLTSVALSYDGNSPLDLSKLGPLMEGLPLFATVYGIFQGEDKRDPATWKPTGPRQVLMRNATSTRAEYEGKGIMGKQARWLMREAKKEGYRGINIECLADAVAYVWTHPPAPFEAEVVCRFEIADWEVEDEKTKEKVKVFAPAKQMATRSYVKI